MLLSWIQKHRIDILLALILFLIGGIPRLTDMGTFLTADEKTWIVRSHEFVRAFKDARFNDMLQTTHPGVTTLWMSGIAISLKVAISHIPFTSDALIYFVKAAQFPVVLSNTIAIPLFYLGLRVLFGRRDIAFLAALFIALDPFIIGYSRVIHVDALLGSALTLAVITSSIYARSPSRVWLILSAVCAAIALLTKIPAIFIIPFLVCAIMVFHPERLTTTRFLSDRGRDLLLWFLIIILLVLLVWPALLWVPNPVGNVLLIKRDVSVAASTPHNMVESYSLKPLHYPAALLDRSNPVTLLGALIGIVGVLFGIYRKNISKEALLIAVYLIGFVVMMTLGAKKGDRYIIPAFFALDILAAWGFAWVVSFVTRSLLRTKIIISGTVLIVGYLAVVVFSYHPYEVAYANPLVRDNLSQELGWGEGLDQVATWLNTEHPGAFSASWYPEELGTYTNAPVLHINGHQQNQVQFVVLYRNMFGREPSHYANDFIDEYFKKQDPVFIAKIHGKEFAWVYEKPNYPHNVGDLTPRTIVVQEVAVEHPGLAGIDILPATRSGRSTEGSYHIEVARALSGEAIFSQSVPVASVKDSMWNPIRFPSSLSIAQGEHLYIRITVTGGSDPYPTLRFSRDRSRQQSMYISRTGIAADAEPKTGSLGVRLMYHAIDGTIATETQTKLLP
jgi:hypothetical protein